MYSPIIPFTECTVKTFAGCPNHDRFSKKLVKNIFLETIIWSIYITELDPDPDSQHWFVETQGMQLFIYWRQIFCPS
jgi:hypothetical protein